MCTVGINNQHEQIQLHCTIDNAYTYTSKDQKRSTFLTMVHSTQSGSRNVETRKVQDSPLVLTHKVSRMTLLGRLFTSQNLITHVRELYTGYCSVAHLSQVHSPRDLLLCLHSCSQLGSPCTPCSETRHTRPTAPLQPPRLALPQSRGSCRAVKP